MGSARSSLSFEGRFEQQHQVCSREGFLDKEDVIERRCATDSILGIAGHHDDSDVGSRLLQPLR